MSYIEDLIERTIDYLGGLDVMGQAYNRKVSIRKIGDHAVDLAKHMILVHHAPTHPAVNHWKKEINAHISNIADHIELKGGKILRPEYIHNELVDGPMGEYSDYVKKHRNVDKDKEGIKLTPHSHQDYDIIHSRYKRMIHHLSKGGDPSYADIEHGE